jgi:hypothetical protein
MTTIRQLELAVAIRDGSARAEDMRELAESLLADCHCPQERMRLQSLNETSGELCCGLCRKPHGNYSGTSWATIKALHRAWTAPRTTETQCRVITSGTAIVEVDGKPETVRINAGDKLSVVVEGGKVTGVLVEPPARDPRVDWNDVRPAVMGGECAHCLHVGPLHEPGCKAIPCRKPEPCACCICWNAIDIPWETP